MGATGGPRWVPLLQACLLLGLLTSGEALWGHHLADNLLTTYFTNEQLVRRYRRRAAALRAAERTMGLTNALQSLYFMPCGRVHFAVKHGMCTTPSFYRCWMHHG